MKVIYNTCFANPWLAVAQKLYREYNWEPVYWNGYHDDQSRALVPEAFPDVVYHSYHSGWKGLFPEIIEKNYSEGQLDIDFLNSIASEELLAIRMMDRMDMDRHSFSTGERQRHFRNLLRKWTVCLDLLKPDAVISAIVPHRGFDFALYLLCRYRQIPYLTFRETAFVGRLVPVSDIQSIGNIFEQRLGRIESERFSEKELYAQLPEDLKSRYDKVMQDYNIAEPDYMKKHVVNHQKSQGVVALTKKFISDVREGSEIYFGEEGYVKEGMSYLVERGKSPEKSKVSISRYAKLKLQANNYKNSLKTHYASLVSEPVWDKPYVIVNLHYQPEMTSNPSGGLFADQALCIDVLTKQIPKNWLIYVKEHRGQFYAQLEGHTGRTKSFYDDLVKFPQVRLLPADANPFKCIQNAQAVVTITGTTGWEAMALGKPVIIFGMSWYEKYKGVLRVIDNTSASRIMPFIEEFEFDRSALLEYLLAMASNSVRAYTQRGHLGRVDVTKEDSVESLSAKLLEMYSDAQASN